MSEVAPTSLAAWSPAFSGQRPPFAPGNELSVTHGAYSPRRVDPLARELVARVLASESVAFLREPAYAPALWAWARAEAQAQLLTEYLARRGEGSEGVGDLDDDRTKLAYLLLHRAEGRAERARARLGLDPLSRAKLGKDIAQATAADAAAALTAMREQHERAMRERADESDAHEAGEPASGEDNHQEEEQ